MLIAEDNEDLRAAIVALITAEPDFACVADTGAGSDVLTLLQRTVPDVLVMDLELGGISAIEILRQATHFCGATIVFSGHNNPNLIERTLAAGASAFLIKGGDFGELFAAIRQYGRRVGRR